jgi:hypothetical protein
LRFSITILLPIPKTAPKALIAASQKNKQFLTVFFGYLQKDIEKTLKPYQHFARISLPTRFTFKGMVFYRSAKP